jgi:predicted SAM-dependent methyltransferase
MTRLNIGSRRRHHTGYTTIDLEEMSGADIIGDFRGMSFENVEEILAEHLLEHFGRDESEKVIDLWNSWLKKGGKIIIETPDFEGICRDFQINKYWMERHCFGSQEAEWAFHRTGWYESKFLEILPKHGFRIEKITFPKSRHILPNIRIVATKI